MFVIGILVVVAIGTIIWAIGSARNEAKEKQEVSDQLDTYTNEIRGVLQPLAVPAGEMASVPPQATEGVVKDLEETTKRWRTSLSSAEQSLTSIVPDRDVEEIHSLVGAAITGYLSAVDTYGLVIETEEADIQTQLLLRATAQREQAGAVVDAAIGILDQLRGDADLGPSGLRAPAEPQTQPTALPTIIPTEAPAGDGGGGDGGGGDGGGGGGSGSSNGKKSGGNGDG
jgi:hypothetical protein